MQTEIDKFTFKNGPLPTSFSFIFGLFKHYFNFCTINVKLILLECGTGIRNSQLIEHESPP